MIILLFNKIKQNMNTIKVSTDVAKLASLFSKSLYSDSYAFITEICQNAVDSHRMSKQTLPVKVGIRLINNSNGPNTYEFYVRDYGLSFTSNNVRNFCSIVVSYPFQ